ncbi:hypothetical protein GCM10010129_03750 [Streptomyces fumigatiscleroticus]|nr:hypothetical protein GCM10010129_03750 [Streptomyces fumigatiscleroticus]
MIADACARACCGDGTGAPPSSPRTFKIAHGPRPPGPARGGAPPVGGIAARWAGTRRPGRSATPDEESLMTVPEENRAKTDTTDEVLEKRDENASRPQGATGRTMREALEEAHVRPDDYDEK